jgi:hypothetical protein
MTAIKIVRFLYLINYVFISSQLLFYMLILKDAMKLISIENFMEQRRVVDLLAEDRLRFLYYSGLILSGVVLFFSGRKMASPFFISAVIASLCLLADLAVAIKGNIPLNAQFNAYTAGADPSKWESLRSQWLTYIQWRGICILIGTGSLLMGLLATKGE